ncbi:unnamed protein product [Prorocentrum cordatum]|uniref:Reverse transcriptase Ty1/copia-type domain-containing protein n=1 Tax=Prorocentrum cordatum TaxID=2364126 RepID=A0ABN9VC99_9DINO|nr:unnamed protein product [Polarella glacialis]
MTEDHRGKVPSWDGDPKTWRTHRRKALQYQEGTKREDRYLCGPRLEAKLTGRAEIAVERCKAGWLSRPDGVERLLAWLERRCSRQAVPDVGQELETFLIKTKRRKLEPMQQWTDRFETGYQYLRRALARALGHTVPVQVASPWRRSERPYRWIEVERDGPFEGSEWTWEYTDGLPDDEKEESHHWSAADQDADAEEELGDMPEVFPSLVLGWLMLVRSGLDSRERAAIIMTATGGSLEVNITREKLISSWEDDDLAERDGHSRFPKAYTAQLGENDRTWLDGDDGPDASSFAADVENCEWQEEDPGQEEANDDDIETYLAAQQEEAEALAAIHTAQRTFRQAREAQADSRLSRGFYRGGAAGTPEASAKVAECRKELKFNLVASLVAEQEPQDLKCEAMFADQAIRKGKGIVDLGCTDAMGGERALDTVARKNMEKYGDARLLHVNLDYRPVYSFGNGEKERAYGQGDIAINGFSKDVPILVSKKVLKKLGAVVDCETGVAVFVKLAPDIPVQLEESPDGGHYYMSLVDDLLEQRVRDQNQLRNFKTICENMREWDRKPVAAVCQGPDSSSDVRAEQLERYMHPSQLDHSSIQQVRAEVSHVIRVASQLMAEFIATVGHSLRWVPQLKIVSFAVFILSLSWAPHQVSEPQFLAEFRCRLKLVPQWENQRAQLHFHGRSGSSQASSFESTATDSIQPPAVPDPPDLPYLRPKAVDVSKGMRWGNLIRGAVQLTCARIACSCNAATSDANAEVLQLLQELGLPRSPAWGVGELKQVLKEHVFPKDETPAQVAMKGLSSMKKSQLLAKAEEVGAHVTQGMANPSLKLSIRKAILMKHTPGPTDYMGFGKHGAVTYQQVQSQCPSYASWCQKEANKESSWELARFVSWLNEQENIDEKAEVTRDPMEVPKEPVKARGGARSSRRRTVDAIMEDEIEEQEKLEAAIKEQKEEKESNLLVQQQMLAALNQLNQRIGQLEDQASSASSNAGSFVPELDPRKQRWLAKCIKENGHLEDYEALMAHGGTKLMEVACSRTSILGTKMAEKFGEDAACRISAWNGFELGTPGGNRRAREARDEAEPDHLWISARCGPLSNLALGFNGSNPIRAEATRKRRLQAIKEYKGAVQLMYDQVAQGKHVHWEWPIKCEGWGHTMIRKMVEDCSMTVVRVAGCQLGVKDKKGLPLLKEWLIAATSPKMAARMSLECSGDHRHGGLTGGGLTAATSYYPDEFARRAVRAMIEEAAPDYHEFPRCLAEPEEVIDQAMAAKQEETKMNTDVNSKEYQQIMKWLTSIHRGSGHSSKASMLNALRRKGASPQVLQVAQDFHCDACEEANKFKPTHPPDSLEAIPPKWKHIQADQFEWEHPQTKVKSKISLVIDENCRVRVSKLLYHMVGEDRHRNPVWADLELFYEERWMPYFGKPQRVKVDPEGSWMSKQAAEYFDSDSIGYEPIPGRAHWHISLAEEAIQAAKGTMDKLVAENPEMTTEEALARATAAGNSREDVRGYSPLQHALGRAPDLEGHFFESDFDELPYVEAQRVDEEFGENYTGMYAAEQEYLRQVYMQRLSRAENAKNQAVKSAAPGMWVRYFRKEKGEAKGRFKGLARVLATETARPVDGDLGEGRVLHPGRAGSVVWLVRAGRIIKVDLCQIRAASSREIAYAELMGGKDTPWTVHTFMNQALNHEYLDFTGHDPIENDVEISTWEGLPDPAPPLKKARTGQAAGDGQTSGGRSTPPVRKRILKKGHHPGGAADQVRASRAALAEEQMKENMALMAKSTPDARAFWARQGTSLEVSVEVPLEGKPLKQATRHMSTYMASQLRKGMREISERTLAPEEGATFNQAKATEVNNYIASSVLETLPPGVTPPPEEIMRKRWILEWKVDENTGAKKPKARIAVLGYMGPEYEHRPTTAPTMTRTSRHLVLQAMAWLGFKGYKADVTGAFTQNREIQHDLFVMPVKELAAALGMPEGVAMRLRKAVYGLVEAAIEWFMTVSEALEEFGWTQMKMDPCAWVLYGDAHGKDNSFTKEALKDFTNPEVLGDLIAAKGDLDIIAIAGSHVDDFLLGGNDADPRWITAREQIEKRFKWKAWESEEFMQTGVRIKQQPDRSFRMDQSEYVKTIEKAYLTPERKKAKDMPTTDKEKGQLRAILGAIGWRSEQSGPMHSADTSLLLSTMPSSIVQTVNATNRLVDRVRECADLPVVIHIHSQSQVLVPVEWSDSSEANRPDGKSTKGLVAGLAPLKILKGDETDVSVISWKSGKIDRGCRSSAACETRSAVDAEDELFGIKLQWLEILGNNIDWRSPEGVLRRLPGAVVVDSKGLHDELQTTVYTFRGKEKRTDVEATTLKEGTQAANNSMLWVLGDAQLADSLTKGHEPGQLRMYFISGHRWKLFYDEKYQSARKWKAAGIQPFEHVGVGILKTPGGSTVHVNAAACPDFPPYEVMTECSSVEEVDLNMLSLEDPYLCNSEYEQA